MTRKIKIQIAIKLQVMYGVELHGAVSRMGIIF